MHHDPHYIELDLRLAVVKLLDKEDATSAEQNLCVAEQIMDICKNDEYLSELESLVPENIQTAGYMVQVRGSFDMLQTTKCVGFLVVEGKVKVSRSRSRSGGGASY